ncbi:MAG TPA: hypothetical protein VGG24_16760, partial [Paraburkholderia sp.]
MTVGRDGDIHDMNLRTGGDRLLIGATFTAKALEAPLMANPQLSRCAASVDFIAARDLLRFLLSGSVQPDTKLLVMLRLCDLLQEDVLMNADLCTRLAGNLRVYLDALSHWQVRTAAPCWVMVVPSPPISGAGESYACERPTMPAGVGFIDWTEFAASSGLARHFDPIADRLGQVPFTIECLRSLADYIVVRTARADALSAATTFVRPVAATGHGNAAFTRFLERLDLHVTCRPMSATESSFAARLAHTAATFHASARTLSEADIVQLQAAPEFTCLTIDVNDRFGQYGSTGFVVIRRGPAPLVEEFVLSCVVLGKQVEEAVLLAIARGAQRAGVTRLGMQCNEQRGGQVAAWLNDLHHMCSD